MFKSIYLSEYGVALTDDEASGFDDRLVELFRILLLPPKDSGGQPVAGNGLRSEAGK